MIKLLRIFLKIILGLVILALTVFGILYAIYDQPKPQSDPSKEADLLAEKMLRAINYEKYQQTSELRWTFANGAHNYEWDKANGIVHISWDDHIVHLQQDSPNESSVFENGIEIIGEKRIDYIKKANTYFNNDSFWLVAPFKLFDKGTTRSIVKLNDGSKGLLVTYTEGGSTPGDTFLWKVKPNGFPESFQMWVQIIPIGGLEVSWDDWKVMENGLHLPTSHELGPFTFSLEAVEAKN